MYKDRTIIETVKGMRLKLDIAETNVSNKKYNATYKKKKKRIIKKAYRMSTTKKKEIAETKRSKTFHMQKISILSAIRRKKMQKRSKKCRIQTVMDHKNFKDVHEMEWKLQMQKNKKNKNVNDKAIKPVFVECDKKLQKRKEVEYGTSKQICIMKAIYDDSNKRIEN